MITVRVSDEEKEWLSYMAEIFRCDVVGFVKKLFNGTIRR